MNEQAPQEKPALKPKRGLAEQIKAEHGEDVYRCYQCQKCSAGCPMTHAMDYPPSQIMRMIQLGQEDELLASKTIWVCLSCNTCSIRCPNDIDIALVIDSLRERALQKGRTPAVKNVPASLRKLDMGAYQRIAAKKSPIALLKDHTPLYLTKPKTDYTLKKL